MHILANFHTFSRSWKQILKSNTSDTAWEPGTTTVSHFMKALCNNFWLMTESRLSSGRFMYRIYSLISLTFLPGIWPVLCLRLIRATYQEGQSFLSAIALTEQKMTFSGQMFTTTPMTQMKKMKMTPTTIYRNYRRTSFFWRRTFLRFWTI